MFKNKVRKRVRDIRKNINKKAIFREGRTCLEVFESISRRNETASRALHLPNPIITSLKPISCYLQEVLKEVSAFYPAIFSSDVKIVRDPVPKIDLNEVYYFFSSYSFSERPSGVQNEQNL